MSNDHLTDMCVDTQILVKASQDDSCLQKEFLVAFMGCKKMSIALDGHVRQEYDEHMKPQRFGQFWLTAMIKSGRSIHRARVSINKSIVNEMLDKHHFDLDDVIFVRLAAATSTKRLAAEDDDYSKPIKALLNRKLGVRVEDCHDSILFINTNL